jgi:hypothetical protein
MDIEGTMKIKLSALILILFSFCWLTSGYAGAYTNTSKKNATPATTGVTHLYLPAFSAINAVGPVKIILKGQQTRQSVTIMAPPDVTAQMVNASVQNGTLFIDAHPSASQPKPILIKINLSQPLHSLLLRGSASAWGEHLSNPNLCIYLQDTGNLHLQGATTTLHSLQNDSTGDITISGLNNQIFIVRGNGSGRITLSGRTRELNVQIGGSLLLQAGDLKADKVHITTQNNAAAYVCPLFALYGFAYDNSSIYYYDNPGKLVRDTHVSGNVLKIIP